MKNKVGIFYGFWSPNFDADYMEYTRKIAVLGFNVLELVAESLKNLSESKRRDLKILGDDLGIEYVLAVDPPAKYDITSPDKAVRADAVKYLKGYFDLVSAMGADTACGIVNGIWNSKIIDTKEAHTVRSITCMKELAVYAEDKGINICLELVNRYEHYMLNTEKEAEVYLDAVGRPNVKIQFDTFHMNVEENNFSSAILSAGKQIGYVHLGENNRRPPGCGFLPWQEIFHALKETGYGGKITLEPLVQRGGEIGDACSIWRDVMPGIDYDGEAKRSLLFVKETWDKA
ncbi:sugar phosphate isomerase/epimerase family protein [Treponema primitia]|uniref:sugar phosphate isomerase/epimerase family protein n=1 Tax=Treponema primitia TaxID=88058 RepID=UPI0002554F1C|nr:sugar phosphate isomerase/epimerase family protein [Treponema primitia]